MDLIKLIICNLTSRNNLFFLFKYSNQSVLELFICGQILMRKHVSYQNCAVFFLYLFILDIARLGDFIN